MHAPFLFAKIVVTVSRHSDNMYNKLFTKILDSSIWLENQPTRIVWITFLACMDQDGVVALSSVGNVANRARVSDQEAEDAINCLESPDIYNPDQEREGCRIERIPGVGWIVLNAQKYRDIIKAETARAQTRQRTREWRERQKTDGDGIVTESDEKVTPSEAGAFAPSEERVATASSPDPETRPLDPRSVHPAIIGIFEVSGIYPPKEIWDEIITRVGAEIDTVKLKKAYTTWRARGYNKVNYDWILEWYLEGIPKLGKNGNGTNRQFNGHKQTPADIITNRPYRTGNTD